MSEVREGATIFTLLSLGNLPPQKVILSVPLLLQMMATAAQGKATGMEE